MNIKDLLLPEFENECKSTLKILDCVPEGQNDWKPHEKSMTLGRLASHVAEMPQWIGWILDEDEYDMNAKSFVRHVCATHAELITYFETKKAQGLAALQQATDEQLMQQWTFRAGTALSCHA